MNELRDLYIPYEELCCHVCLNRTPYLRSGIKSHLLNFHNQDENGEPILKKKAAKRRSHVNSDQNGAHIELIYDKAAANRSIVG
ncbi:hypothetical protein QTP88_005555 [Uroleucon formosanum]